MSATSRIRFACLLVSLLFACGLQGNDISINVSGDPGLPWGAFQGDIFSVGFPSNNVQFTTSSSYSGPSYTVVSTGMYFNVYGWTSVYTLLARDARPVEGAYLAITVGQDSSVSYHYSINASQSWDIGTGGFSSSSPTTWANVANTLFPPPPPPAPPIQTVTPNPIFLPPPVIITPNLSPLTPIGPADIGNPEPATGLLMVTGIAGFWLWRRKRAKA